MKSLPKRDLSASVKQRLLTLARDRSEQFQHILIRYAIERLLYRLSRSLMPGPPRVWRSSSPNPFSRVDQTYRRLGRAVGGRDFSFSWRDAIRWRFSMLCRGLF